MDLCRVCVPDCWRGAGILSSSGRLALDRNEITASFTAGGKAECVAWMCMGRENEAKMEALPACS